MMTGKFLMGYYAELSRLELFSRKWEQFWETDTCIRLLKCKVIRILLYGVEWELLIQTLYKENIGILRDAKNIFDSENYDV